MYSMNDKLLNKNKSNSILEIFLFEPTGPKFKDKKNFFNKTIQLELVLTWFCLTVLSFTLFVLLESNKFR